MSTLITLFFYFVQKTASLCLIYNFHHSFLHFIQNLGPFYEMIIANINLPFPDRPRHLDFQLLQHVQSSSQLSEEKEENIKCIFHIKMEAKKRS